jgi:serine/threonine protein kinase
MIVHRDLKLGNLLLGQNMDIKVGDFGLSAKLTYNGERRNSSCGTPNYMAPEQLDPFKGHSFEADIWALGVIIYYMVVGRSPFSENAKDIKHLHSNINDVLYTFPPDLKISNECKDLISCLLQKKESNRIKVD